MLTKLNTRPPPHVNHEGFVPPTDFGDGVLVLAPEQDVAQGEETAAYLEETLVRAHTTRREAYRQSKAEQN